jgi:hypothetical protein
MYALVSTAAAAALLMASFACAQDQPRTAAGDAKAQAHRPAATSHNSAQAHRDADHGQPASANQARYRRHNGRWWYWMPDNRWVVWQRNSWVPYRPGMFVNETAATRQPARRFSYDPGSAYPYAYPRLYNSPSPYGVNQSIRNAASKANFDYNPYTGGSMQ